MVNGGGIANAEFAWEHLQRAEAGLWDRGPVGEGQAEGACLSENPLKCAKGQFRFRVLS